MGRLSTIEDVERKTAMAEGETSFPSLNGKIGPRASDAKHIPSDSPSQSAEHPKRPAKQQSTGKPSKSEAQKEVDFHGLDNLEKKSGGHIALIVVAVLIVIVAGLKVAGVF